MQHAKLQKLKSVTLGVSLAGAIMVVASAASAAPFLGSIINDGENGNNAPGGFSLIHNSATPSGSTLYDYDNQAFNFDVSQTSAGGLTAGDVISLSTPQVLSLEGGDVVMTITSFTLTVDDPMSSDPNGYVDAAGNSLDALTFYQVYGSMNYSLDHLIDDSKDVASGTFTFDLMEHGSTAFNSATFDNGTNTLSAFIWGGDEDNDLGTDFAFSGVAATDPGEDVPEPGTLLVFGSGLLATWATRRRLRRREMRLD